MYNNGTLDNNKNECSVNKTCLYIKYYLLEVYNKKKLT